MVNATQLNSLNMGKKELDSLLDKLQKAHDDHGVNERSDKRMPFRVVQASLTVIDSNHGETEIMVATSNISQGGISVLHKSFLYPNTRCRIRIGLEDGKQLKLAGKVIRCAHIQGNAHEIGIQFDSSIKSQNS